jgi:hypothetical protein
MIAMIALKQGPTTERLDNLAVCNRYNKIGDSLDYFVLRSEAQLPDSSSRDLWEWIVALKWILNNLNKTLLVLHIQGHPELRKTHKEFTWDDCANFLSDRVAEEAYSLPGLSQEQRLRACCPPGFMGLYHNGINLTGEVFKSISTALSIDHMEKYFFCRKGVGKEEYETTYWPLTQRSIKDSNSTDVARGLLTHNKLLSQRFPTNNHLYDTKRAVVSSPSCNMCEEDCKETEIHIWLRCTNVSMANIRRERARDIHRAIKKILLPKYNDEAICLCELFDTNEDGTTRLFETDEQRGELHGVWASNNMTSATLQLLEKICTTHSADVRVGDEVWVTTSNRMMTTEYIYSLEYVWLKNHEDSKQRRKKLIDDIMDIDPNFNPTEGAIAPGGGIVSGEPFSVDMVEGSLPDGTTLHSRLKDVNLCRRTRSIISRMWMGWVSNYFLEMLSSMISTSMAVKLTRAIRDSIAHSSPELWKMRNQLTVDSSEKTKIRKARIYELWDTLIGKAKITTEEVTLLKKRPLISQQAYQRAILRSDVRQRGGDEEKRGDKGTKRKQRRRNDRPLTIKEAKEDMNEPKKNDENTTIKLIGNSAKRSKTASRVEKKEANYTKERRAESHRRQHDKGWSAWGLKRETRK